MSRPPKLFWLGADLPLELLDATGATLHPIHADPARPDPRADHFAEGGGHPLLRAELGHLLAHATAPGTVIVLGAHPAPRLALYHALLALGPETPLPVPTLVPLLHQPGAAAAARNRATLTEAATALGATSAAIAAAITRRNRLRATVAALDAARTAPVPRISAPAMDAIARSWGSADEEAAIAAAATAPAPDPAARRILLVGEFICPPLLAALDRAGLHVLGQDHALALPLAGPLVADPDPDPLAALARAYALPLPTIAERAHALPARARALAAHAVLFAVPGFEHPTAWAIPTLDAALRAAGIPTLILPQEYWRDPQEAATLAAHSLGSRP